MHHKNPTVKLEARVHLWVGYQFLVCVG